MSHKIKLNLKKNSKSLEELPNQKISITLGKKSPAIKASYKQPIVDPVVTTPTIKPVTLDQHLYKQFKKSDFSKIDLHGSTVDEAHQKLLVYLKKHYEKKNPLHIIITGLGNKSSDGEFFTGKIRKQFPLWLEKESFQKYVKSYSSCKIQHGGLGAFYIKLKAKE